MREKLQTLPLTQLRSLAKSQGIKGSGTLRKAELIEALCKAAEQEEIMRTAVAPPAARQAANNRKRACGFRPARPPGIRE